jgi:hypothetical protein
MSILMTETLIMKYSFVLYSFKFLTGLPKFSDIKNNIIQHHSWMRFPRELWMHSMILEVKFAYVVVRLFVYDLTSKHVPNKRVIRCTNKLPIVNMVMHCQRPIMNINYNGYFTQWLRITQLRNESQSKTFLRNNRQVVLSASCPFGKLSVRQNVRSAKCPFGKTSVRQNVFRQNVFRQSVFRQSVFRQNVRVPN